MGSLAFAQRREIYEKEARRKFSEYTRNEAHAILQRPLPGTKIGTLLQLAHFLEMKEFLSHEHCTSLTRRWWTGGYRPAANPRERIFTKLPEDMGFLHKIRFTITSIFPLFNKKILLDPMISNKAADEQVRMNTHDVFDVLATTIRVVQAERRASTAPLALDAFGPPALRVGKSLRPPGLDAAHRRRKHSRTSSPNEGRPVSEAFAEEDEREGRRRAAYRATLQTVMRRLVVYYQSTPCAAHVKLPPRGS